MRHDIERIMKELEGQTKVNVSITSSSEPDLKLDAYQQQSSPEAVRDSHGGGLRRKSRVYRTLLSLGLAYFLIYLSYGTFEMLQSTLHVESGLGTTSVGVMYAFIIASNMLLAPTIVDRLGINGTLCVSWLLQALYTAANAVPRWETLVPTSAAYGITVAATNIVYGIYVTTMAEDITREAQRPSDQSSGLAVDGGSGKDSDVTNESGHQTKLRTPPSRQTDNAVVRINSILLMFIHTGSILGSLLGSLVIGSATDTADPFQAIMTNTTLISSSWIGDNASTLIVTENPIPEVTTEMRYEVTSSEVLQNGRLCGKDLSFCGVNHCPYLVEHVSGFVPSDRTPVYIVAAIAIAFNLAAIAVVVLLLRSPRTPRSSCVNCRKHQSETTNKKGDVNGNPEVAAVGIRLVEGDGVLTTTCSDDVDDSNEVVGDCQKTVKGNDVRLRIVGTFRVLADRRLQLLIPTIVLIGVVQSFAIGAFNQSFVACLLGVNAIGYATLCFRGALIVASLVTGQLSRCVRRRTIIVSAQVSTIAIISTWFIPLPGSVTAVDDDNGIVLPALVLTWCTINGAILGIFRTAFYSTYTVLFRENLSYVLAQSNIWESLGTAIAFFVNDRLCFGSKAYAFITLAVVSLLTYVILEYLILKPSKSAHKNAGL